MPSSVKSPSTKTLTSFNTLVKNVKEPLFLEGIAFKLPLKQYKVSVYIKINPCIGLNR